MDQKELALKRKNVALILAVMCLTVVAMAGDKKPAQKSKQAEPVGTVVDSGSFGIYISGKRVATESFTVKQFADYSVTESELKLEDGKPAQACRLQMKQDGNLQRYDWHVVSDVDKSAVLLQPENEILIQHITLPDLKTAEQKYLLNPATQVLDDYFFSQREILLWRYIAGNCRSGTDKAGCILPKTQFGIIIPRQRLSALYDVQYIGRDKLTYKGAEGDFGHFKISPEGSEWHLWLNNEHRLVRISIPTENTEVLRD